MKEYATDAQALNEALKARLGSHLALPPLLVSLHHAGAGPFTRARPLGSQGSGRPRFRPRLPAQCKAIQYLPRPRRPPKRSLQRFLGLALPCFAHPRLLVSLHQGPLCVGQAFQLGLRAEGGRAFVCSSAKDGSRQSRLSPSLATDAQALTEALSVRSSRRARCARFARPRLLVSLHQARAGRPLGS